MRPVPENTNWIVQALKAHGQIKPANREAPVPMASQGQIDPLQLRLEENDQYVSEAIPRPRSYPLRVILRTALYAIYRPIRPLVRSIMWRSRTFFSQPILEEIASSRLHMLGEFASSNMRFVQELTVSNQRLVDETIPRLEHLAKEMGNVRSDLRALASVPHMLMELAADSAVLKRDLAEVVPLGEPS
jgi:hypothetical protein